MTTVSLYIRIADQTAPHYPGSPYTADGSSAVVWVKSHIPQPTVGYGISSLGGQRVEAHMSWLGHFHSRLTTHHPATSITSSPSALAILNRSTLSSHEEEPWQRNSLT